MDSFLIDVNIFLDIVFRRDTRSIICFERLVNLGKELYVTSSMLPILDYFFTKYKVNKKEFKKHFVTKFKIITSTGKEGYEALEYKDSEDALIALAFKRVCPMGVIVTNDKEMESCGLPVYSPEELLAVLRDVSEGGRQIPILDLKKQYRYIMEEIEDALLKTAADAQYILGPQVKELEDKIAKYLDVKHCIGASSGTEALVLSLRALAIKLKGQEYFDKADEIITTPFTFTATGDAILRAGATPVFVDIDLATYNIDPSKIEEYLKSTIRNPQSKIRGIIPVHLYGQPCNMDEIMKIAKEYNLFVLEDVAQAFGGTWNGKKLGSVGVAGTFSFFPSKNLGGFGDGGMVSTNDDELAELMRMLLKHGGKDKYNVEHIGYNARLDTLQAAILLAKFKYIDEFNERRRKIAEIYNHELSSVHGVVIPMNHSTIQPCNKATSQNHDGHVYHQYTLRVNNGKRDALQTHLKEKGISTMVYYPVPLHKMKVFEGRCKLSGSLKDSENAVTEVLSLPVEPLQTEDITHEVIKSIRELKL